jgi:hypothetical protein
MVCLTWFLQICRSDAGATRNWMKFYQIKTNQNQPSLSNTIQSRSESFNENPRCAGSGDAKHDQLDTAEKSFTSCDPSHILPYWTGLPLSSPPLPGQALPNRPRRPNRYNLNDSFNLTKKDF